MDSGAGSGINSDLTRSAASSFSRSFSQSLAPTDFPQDTLPVIQHASPPSRNERSNSYGQGLDNRADFLETEGSLDAPVPHKRMACIECRQQKV